MNIILDTYYNITGIQATYYDKVATGSLFSYIYIYIYIYLSSHCTKIQVDGIDNGLFTLILNTPKQK